MIKLSTSVFPSNQAADHLSGTDSQGQAPSRCDGLNLQSAIDAKRLAIEAVASLKRGDISIEEANTIAQLLTLQRDFTILEDRERKDINPRPSGISWSATADNEATSGGARVFPINTTIRNSIEPDGVAGLPESNPPIDGTTITIFETKYLSFLEGGHSEKYVRDARAALEWLRAKTGDVAIAAIRQNILESAFAADFKHAMHGTARHYRTLKAAFNKGVQWDLISENPFVKFKLPKIPDSTMVVLNDEELSRVLKHTKDNTLQDIFRCAFHTGMRLGEILNLRWKAVNLEDRLILVSNTEEFTTKSKRERKIPIGDKLHAMFTQMSCRCRIVDDKQIVFSKDGHQFKGNHVSHRFKVAARKAGLDESIHFHSLRHSFASNLIARGTNPVHVKELMGHSNLATTMRYTHVQLEDLRAAVNKLG